MCRSIHGSHLHHGRRCAPAHPFSAFEHHHYPGDLHARSMGMRRPLRFLAWRLMLDEKQVAELATLLNALKTERAQADVDDRRALALLADAAQGEPFDCDKAAEAARLRSQSVEHVQKKVVETLERLHALLNPEQRERLAYLLRTGMLVM